MSWRRTPPLAFVFVVIVINPFTADSLDCHRAEYEVNNLCCLMCLPGSRVETDCTEYRSTSCLPCVEGTFTDERNGLKSCLPCYSCDSGSGLKMKTNCTITSDTVCEPLEGFYCIDSTRDGCTAAREHRRCDPGQFIQQEGTASTDTECSDCPDGTFSDGTTTQCRPHTKCEELNLQQKTAGTNSADAECEARSETGIIAAVVLSVLVLSAITGAVILCRKQLQSFETTTKKTIRCLKGATWNQSRGGELPPTARRFKRWNTPGTESTVTASPPEAEEELCKETRETLPML